MHEQASDWGISDETLKSAVRLQYEGIRQDENLTETSWSWEECPEEHKILAVADLRRALPVLGPAIRNAVIHEMIADRANHEEEIRQFGVNYWLTRYLTPWPRSEGGAS